jgi:hypothetical protein
MGADPGHADEIGAATPTEAKDSSRIIARKIRFIDLSPPPESLTRSL